MRVIEFLHHLFNPHCPDCKDEQDNKKICNVCEVLKVELENARAENRRLLSAILKDDVTVTSGQSSVPQVLRGRHTSWNVKRQILENEDRHRAELEEKKRREMSNTPNSTEVPKDSSVVTEIKSPQSVEDLEKELGVANNV